MTTEAALRSALARLISTLSDSPGHHDEDDPCRTCGAFTAARAALALPVEERMEYRVQYSLGGPQCMDARDLADAQNLAECLDGKVTIEARSVSTGPWLPLESV